MKHVIFSRRNEILRLPLATAFFFEAYGNYCYAVFPNKQKVVLPIGLSQVETIIAQNIIGNQPMFMRIGKRFIVNMDVVAQVDLTKSQLVLSDFDHPGSFAIPMSKDALKLIKELYTNEKIWKSEKN